MGSRTRTGRDGMGRDGDEGGHTWPISRLSSSVSSISVVAAVVGGNIAAAAAIVFLIRVRVRFVPGLSLSLSLSLKAWTFEPELK